MLDIRRLVCIHTYIQGERGGLIEINIVSYSIKLMGVRQNVPNRHIMMFIILIE